MDIFSHEKQNEVTAVVDSNTFQRYELQGQIATEIAVRVNFKIKVHETSATFFLHSTYLFVGYVHYTSMQEPYIMYRNMNKIHTQEYVQEQRNMNSTLGGYVRKMYIQSFVHQGYNIVTSYLGTIFILFFLRYLIAHPKFTKQEVV